MKSLAFHLCAAVVILGTAAPTRAESSFHLGLMTWRHQTDLDIEKATDFDGGPDGGELLKDWEVDGSGWALVAAYEFPRILSVYARLGMGTVTVTEDDTTTAPGPDVDSLGFDDGFYFALGAQAEGTVPSNESIFWAAQIEFSMLSADFDKKVDSTAGPPPDDESWDYDETNFSLQGTVGYSLEGIDVYGGLRFVMLDVELEETDLSELPGPTKRDRDLERDGQVDILLGVRGGSEKFNAFFELGLLGTFSATAGMEYRF